MGQKLGQHFLSDLPMLMDIDEHIQSVAQRFGLEHCIEIGPGAGALTRFLIPAFTKKILLEKDRSLASALAPVIDKNTEIVWGDVLEEGPRLIGEGVGDSSRVDGADGDDADCGSDASGKTPLDLSDYLLVGNLPYYITSPIFRTFFVEHQVFDAGVFLIQDEVARKLATSAKKRSFLWRLVNYYYTVEYNFRVDKTKFTPPPKVQSAIVTLKRKSGNASEFRTPKIKFQDMVDFLEVVNPYSRKTLGKISKLEKSTFSERNYVLPDALSTKRVEKLSREELASIVYGS